MLFLSSLSLLVIQRYLNDHLESSTDNPATLELAQGTTSKLDTLDKDFRTHHHALVDLIDDEETLLAEQTTLGEHDDLIAELSAHTQQLINACTPSSDTPLRKIASRRLTHLKKALSSIKTAITSSDDELVDVCLLSQYEEKLGDCKKELVDVRNSLLSLDMEETDEVYTSQVALEGEIFDCSLQIKKLLPLQLHLWTARESSYLNLKCQLLMVTFSSGGPFGNSSMFLSMIIPPFLILRSWCTCNNR